jgi:hypothetical protein
VLTDTEEPGQMRTSPPRAKRKEAAASPAVIVEPLMIRKSPAVITTAPLTLASVADN